MDYQDAGFKIGSALTGKKAKQILSISVGLAIGLMAMKAITVPKDVAKPLTFDEALQTLNLDENRNKNISISYDYCTEIISSDKYSCLNYIQENKLISFSEKKSLQKQLNL